MLLICDDSVTLPLKIIFRNILLTSIYPDIWKLANVIPIFKKGDKQSIKNYGPVSLLPFCDKIIEKIIFNNLYSYLKVESLWKNSGFLQFCPKSKTHPFLCKIYRRFHF